ncbi:MAG TPA: TIGR04325 family methyltransferase [Steroidobacteraceae bacterium]|nr:TIGR04325 family methyltransferase [Steroidobacteraceae bacterium]
MSAKQTLFVPPTPTQRVLRKALEILLGRLPIGSLIGRIPGVQRLHAKRLMARRDHTGLHSGVYASYADALAHVPPSRLAGWDHEDSSTLWVGQIDPVKLSTYPVFFWLNRLYHDGMALIDVGGSIGLTYYGYRRYAGLPSNTSWTVVEVPKICEQGIKTAARENARNLHFLSDLNAAGNCDILLSAGALQFMEHSLPGLLESLAAKPRYILLNKLPVTPAEECWTLQNYGPAVTPHRLFNEGRFLGYFEGHGYRLRDRWEVPDLDCLIPFHPRRFIGKFSGFLFELAV